MTCPRCHGTGHIRGIESSALHILRIMQEEAMKENTAAVHAQVPVDVATFLLNEKRGEFQSIEQRLKVNVVLIPNMHLETPNYTVTRLKHEELNQADLPPPSYEMVAMPEKTDGGFAGLRRTEPATPRQEAAVKGITPSQPAPYRRSHAETPCSGGTGAAGRSVHHQQDFWLVQAPATETPEAETRRAHPRADPTAENAATVPIVVSAASAAGAPMARAASTT